MPGRQQVRAWTYELAAPDCHHAAARSITQVSDVSWTAAEHAAAPRALPPQPLHWHRRWTFTAQTVVRTFAARFFLQIILGASESCL